MSKKALFEICRIACRVYLSHARCSRFEKWALTKVQVTVALSSRGSVLELRLFLTMHMCSAEV